MPRYRFHTHDGVDVRDEEGTELPDFDSVRREAMRLASKLLNDDLKKVGLGDEWWVEVEDEDRDVVFRIRVAMAETDVPCVKA